jgi:3-oxoacyl-[acyl-carrier protein] reductase
VYTQGKNIIISGGSRGLGLALTEYFLENGNTIATFARSKTDAITKLEETYGDKLHFIACDSRDYKTLRGFVNQFAQATGNIDGLINNAAIGQDHMLTSTAPEVISDIIDINIQAPIHLTRMVLKHLLVQGQGGEIVNISSICGSRGYTGLTIYSASKGAMDAFTRSLAREVGARKIHCNSICPGFFESDMSSVLLPEQLDAIKRRTPNGQLSEPEHITRLADLLLSGTTNINGQSLFVDGGASI